MALLPSCCALASAPKPANQTCCAGGVTLSEALALAWVLWEVSFDEAMVHFLNRTPL